MLQKSNNKTLLLTTLSIILCFSLQGESIDSLNAKYLSLFRQKKYSKSILKLKKILKKRKVKNENIWYYKLALAKCLRLSKKTNEGLNVLKSLTFVDKGRTEVRLEQGLCLHALGKFQDALDFFTLCSRDRDILNRCIANYSSAEIYFQTTKYKMCIDICKLILQEQSSDLQVKKIIEKAKILLKKASKKLIYELYGKDYFYYQEARFAQEKKQYKDAIKSYKKITVPMLSDASKCYIAECLSELGNTKEAYKKYSKFIHTDPFGFYRAEAMFKYAYYLCLQGGSKNLSKASKLLNNTLLWHAEIINHPTKSKYNKLDTILKDFPLPEAAAGKNAFGNMIRKFTSPEAIVNRITLPWYLSHLKLNTYMLNIYVQFRIKNIELSIKNLDDMLHFNKANGGMLFSYDGVQENLRMGLKNGHFTIDKQTWNKVSRYASSYLLLACYYYSAGEYSQAKKLVNKISISHTKKKITRLDMDVIMFLKALIYFKTGKEKDTVKYLETFTQKRSKSRLAPQAQIILANIYSGHTKKLKRAFKLYSSVARKWAKTKYAPQALLSLAISATNMKMKKNAINACLQIKKKYYFTPYAKTAELLLKKLDTFKKSDFFITKKDTNKDPRNPDTHYQVIRKHLLYPGGGNMKINYSKMTEKDLLRYYVSYSTRSKCVKVRNFKLRLNEYEPQMLPVNENFITFLRAPVLFLPSLN